MSDDSGEIRLTSEQKTEVLEQVRRLIALRDEQESIIRDLENQLDRSFDAMEAAIRTVDTIDDDQTLEYFFEIAVSGDTEGHQGAVTLIIDGKEPDWRE